MTMKNKLTLKDLIARKAEVKGRKTLTKDLYVKSLDATITIKSISRGFYLDAGDLEPKKGDVHLLYNAVIEPNLQDTELHKEFGVNEPTEIVDAIFTAGEVISISTEILKLSGFGGSVQEIKN